jgi:hypothetical protein
MLSQGNGLVLNNESYLCRLKVTKTLESGRSPQRQLRTSNRKNRRHFKLETQFTPLEPNNIMQCTVNVAGNASNKATSPTLNIIPKRAN